MSEIPQAPFRWTGEVMAPLNRHWSAIADRAYVVGEVYALAPMEERSSASHRHYFACIREAWQNLPELLAEAYPSPEALRAFALIKAGYCDAHPFVCASKAEAIRFATYLKPVDAFALVTVKEAVVTRYTAKSQSLRAMGKADFQASKDRVLEIVAEMVGVETGALVQHARAA